MMRSEEIRAEAARMSERLIASHEALSDLDQKRAEVAFRAQVGDPGAAEELEKLDAFAEVERTTVEALEIALRGAQVAEEKAKRRKLEEERAAHRKRAEEAAALIATLAPEVDAGDAKSAKGRRAMLDAAHRLDQSLGRLGETRSFHSQLNELSRRAWNGVYHEAFDRDRLPKPAESDAKPLQAIVSKLLRDFNLLTRMEG